MIFVVVKENYREEEVAYHQYATQLISVIPVAAFENAETAKDYMFLNSKNGTFRMYPVPFEKEGD